MQAHYFYYRAHNYSDNSAVGLPYGAGAQEHGVTVSLIRRISDHVRLTLKYGYFNNRNDTAGGRLNYDAHLVYSGLQYAWEYSTAGDLSKPNGDPNIQGPASAGQAKIPDGIKQARYNLYLVAHDGSYGVHNGKCARYLLQVAQDKVNALMSAP